MCIYIGIYIYREREREREIRVHMYTYNVPTDITSEGIANTLFFLAKKVTFETSQKGSMGSPVVLRA